MSAITDSYRPIGLEAGYIRGTNMIPRFVEAGTLISIYPDDLAARYNGLLMERDELRATIAQQAAQLEQAQTAIREARQQLRATQENWREECLYRANDILSAALGEEAQHAQAQQA